MINLAALVGKITGRATSADAAGEKGVATGDAFAALVRFAADSAPAAKQPDLRLVVDNDTAQASSGEAELPVPTMDTLPATILAPDTLGTLPASPCAQPPLTPVAAHLPDTPVGPAAAQAGGAPLVPLPPASEGDEAGEPAAQQAPADGDGDGDTAVSGDDKAGLATPLAAVPAALAVLIPSQAAPTGAAPIESGDAVAATLPGTTGDQAGAATTHPARPDRILRSGPQLPASPGETGQPVVVPSASLPPAQAGSLPDIIAAAQQQSAGSMVSGSTGSGPAASAIQPSGNPWRAYLRRHDAGEGSGEIDSLTGASGSFRAAAFPSGTSSGTVTADAMPTELREALATLRDAGQLRQPAAAFAAPARSFIAPGQTGKGQADALSPEDTADTTRLTASTDQSGTDGVAQGSAPLAPTTDMPAAAEAFRAATLPLVTTDRQGLAATTASGLAPAGGSTADALGDQVIDMGVSGQWIDRMAREITTLAQGGGTSRFVLNPPHLGRLDVEVALDSDIAHIRMTTETDEAARRLHEARQTMQADSRVAALSIGSFTVEKAHGQQDAGRDQSGGQRPAGDMAGQAQQQGAGTQGQAYARSGGDQNQQQRGDWTNRFAREDISGQTGADMPATGRESGPGGVRFA